MPDARIEPDRVDDEAKEAPPWVDGLTVGQVLRRTAERFPDRDALVFPALGVRYSWAELDRRVDAVAAGLIAQGVAAGEHVGIWSMNVPEWVVAQFAVARAGAVLVNVNPAYRLHELEGALKQADVATLLVGEPFKYSDFVRMIEELAPEAKAATGPGWRSARLPTLRRLVALGDCPGPGWIAWSDLEAAEPGPELAARDGAVGPDDPFDVQFTSGTTGLPKGAMLSHRNVLMNAYYIGQRTRFTENDRVCVPVPFYHCFGCVLGTEVCSVYGSAIVVPAPCYDAGDTLRALASERCTALYGVPTMFVSVLDHPDRPGLDLSALRTGIMAGSPCPLPLMKAVVDDLGAEQIVIGYGLTEASPIITMTDADDPIEVRVGTVGREIPGVEVRLRHPTTGEVVPPGEAGELLVKGHGVMAGYYNAPEATAKVLDADGWLATGDLARRRPDGNYRIVGRSKELIIRGGENIYPPEVEEFLCHLPAWPRWPSSASPTRRMASASPPGSSRRPAPPSTPTRSARPARAKSPTSKSPNTSMSLNRCRGPSPGRSASTSSASRASPASASPPPTRPRRPERWAGNRPGNPTLLIVEGSSNQPVAVPIDVPNRMEKTRCDKDVPGSSPGRLRSSPRLLEWPRPTTRARHLRSRSSAAPRWSRRGTRCRVVLKPEANDPRDRGDLLRWRSRRGDRRGDQTDRGFGTASCHDEVVRRPASPTWIGSTETSASGGRIPARS